MNETLTKEHTPHTRRPILSTLSLLLAGAMILAVLIGIAGGLTMHWKGQVALLIMASLPVCALGTALALIGLIWRAENPSLAQFGLWINGLFGFFAFPILCFWLIR